jgi:hypothetical protein
MKRLAFLAASLLFTACASYEGEDLDASAASELNAGSFLYFRCSSTGFSVSNATRLVPTGTPDTVALTYKVTQSWMVTDKEDCSFLETPTQNAWGNWQRYYGSTVQKVVVPGSASLGPASTSQVFFQVKYPKLGDYRIVLNTKTGAFSIQPATSTETAPKIVKSPELVRATVGAPATFSVEASGTNLKYQWQSKLFNETTWANVPGGTAAALTITTPAVDVFCRYFRVVVSNSLGSVTSAENYVFPILPAPVLTKDLPATVTAKAGTAVTLGIETAAPVTLYWHQINGAPPSFTGEKSYTSAPLTLADSGMTVQISAVNYAGNHVCGGHGVAASTKATITVVP